MRCFIAIVEEGTLAKAAAALNMTQPPLSLSIRKLETELGVTLFDRTEKKLKLTESGKLLYQRGQSLLASVEEIKGELVEHDNGIRGVIHVGCSTSANLFFIPKMIEKLQVENPNIVVHVSAGTSSLIFDQLRKQKLDVGIVPVILHAEDFHVSQLYSEPLMVVLPPGHHLLGKKEIHLSDLRHEKFMLPDTSIGESAFNYLITACHTSGFSPNVVYWGTETLPMIILSMKGVGITFAPSSFRDFYGLNGKRPHLVELTSPKLRFTYSLVYFKNRFQPKVIGKFIETARELAKSIY